MAQAICFNPADNCVYVAGYFTGTVDFDPSAGVFNLVSTGGNDIFIAKYTAAGAFVWAVRAGSTGTDRAQGIYADANGVYVTGYCQNTTTFRSTNTATVGSSGAFTGNNSFLVKYDLAGVVQWAATQGGAGSDIGYAVTADASGIYMIGEHTSAPLSINNSAGVTFGNIALNGTASDVFLVGYSQAGAVTWTNNIASNGADFGRGICGDATHLYVTGGLRNNASFTFPSAVFTGTSNGNADLYVAKMNKSNGVFQWVRCEAGFGSTGDQIGRAIAYHGAGRVFITGECLGGINFVNSGGGTISSVGNRDVFVAGYNTSGQFYYAGIAGGASNDFGYGIDVNNIGDVYIGGDYQTSAATFGALPVLPANTTSNIFVAKIGCGNLLSIANAGPSQTVCPSSATMAANTPTNGTGNWTLLSGSGTITNPSQANTTITGLGLGLNQFIWTISGFGCTPTIDTVDIFMNPGPTPANAGPNQTVCATTATLNGNVPGSGTGLWTLVSGSGVVTNPTQANTGITGLGVGVNVFQWTTTLGSCSTTSTVSITRDNFPSVSNAGPSQSICATSSNFAANTPAVGTGTWSLVSGVGFANTPNKPNSAVTFLGNGVNVFSWTIGNGICPTSSSTVAITSYANPTNSDAGPPQTICANTGTLAGNTPAAGTGSWTLVFGAGTISSPTNPGSTVTGLGIGSNVFAWTITNGVCPASTSTTEIFQDQMPSTATVVPN